MNEKNEDALISRNDVLDAFGHGTTYTSEEIQRIVKTLPAIKIDNQLVK